VKKIGKYKLYFLIGLIGICFLIIYNLKFSKQNDYHSFTKAICSDNNYCIDILISCNGDRVINIKPITEGMYFDNNLVNGYRNQTYNESWC
jgi:hypothetical protein